MPEKRPPETETLLDFPARRVPLVFKTNARARRIILRLDYRAARIVVVLPRRVSRAEGRRFAQLHHGWLAERVPDLHPAIPFHDGARLPLLGREHVIRHRPERRGAVWREADEIHVAGESAHLPRRLRDWLKGEAKHEIEKRAVALAKSIGAKARKIAVRDTRSRWGSCTVRGDLAFSWRVILAPEHVLDYIVAHEVAHLKEMNHGPRFWSLCASLCPGMRSARDWLKRHGTRLYRYGAES